MDADEVPAEKRREGWWWKALLSGLSLWAAVIVVTATTHSSALIPTLILVGSFLVPFCVVLFVVERVSGILRPLDVFMAFLLGGVFGVLGASLLESDLHPSPWLYLQVALVEEFVKALILIAVPRSALPRSAAQGGFLGACVGAGFAAFESAGYAFNAAVTTKGIDLASLLQSEATRSILAPVCHVLWTALLGVVIFGAARGFTRFRITAGVLGAFVGVVALHALWDGMQDLSLALASAATGTRQGEPLASGFYVIGLVVVAVTGLASLSLAVRYHEADKKHMGPEAEPGETPRT
ncbi:PrsW family glutamic-type intramembrane protease [Sinomonas sp. JGH33]|uniref:PrsW family glutamic-type intramembrane protease n=1 Tax=Sinomonas terricola TaxID=3110330 RepID=A0ABU5TE26_9MICC|nr:PrsW family glutamic-type intramembrane protease [Sinomonas sp. JGH33]MEA5457341.1 PrsW family glutamic-type intramembrane protease [Sinomonas sp. JGH33]